MGGTITITKLDAARRQLGTAIELWFCDGDPVSIHTLVASAHQIIHDLNRRTKGPDLLYDTIVVKDEYRKECISAMKAAAAFFKHADRGKSGIAKSVELDTGITEILMLTSVIGVQYLIKRPYENIEAAFLLWHRIHHSKGHPRWTQAVNERIPVDGLDTLRLINKHDFLEQFIETKRRAKGAC